MITIVLTNRNRDLRIIKNCFDSLQNQTDVDFDWFLIDYGSQEDYLKKLNSLVSKYPKINYLSCPTKGQLWSKCRSINIALKKTNQPYFVVGDIDLVYHPNYIKILKSLANPNQVHYFQYGFLSEKESLKKQRFEDFEIDFKGNHEVTGNTMFPSKALKSINGFDEFYQGWGAEDTDAHIRMKNAGLTIHFYDKEVLVKHQWHPKAYRSKLSTHPFHSSLERINHAYINQTEQTKRTVVNQLQEWGKVPDELAYEMLNHPTLFVNIKSSIYQINAALAQLNNFNNEVVCILVKDYNNKQKNVNRFKRIFGKKNIPMYSMEFVNNLFLEEIIKKYRNYPYTYSFNRQENSIELIINFTK